MSNIDILEIHNEICEKFVKDKENIEEFQLSLKKLEKLLSDPSLSYNIRKNLEKKWENLKEKIKDIEYDTSYNFYIMETTQLIENYKKIIRKPIKMNFMGKKQNNNTKQTEIINNFLKIAKNYKNIKEQATDENIIECTNCDNNTSFDIVNSYYMCQLCGAQLFPVLKYSSYKDIERVNISGKYTYDRKIHFRDCLNQFQGKQNSTVPEKVYDELIKQFKLHGLLVDSKNKKIKFSKITKEHIHLFLKETGNSKYYEDVNLIRNKLTGIKSPDISHIESKLLEDFDILTTAYDKKFRKNKKYQRKNFINTQYVLYQLLKKYKFPCRRSDFNILKTTDRKSFHDEICKELFNKLNWNFTSLF